MPQMGESITEGTVARWHRNVGDAVERDEPLLEISTDKVEAEIPSPTSGRLIEVMVATGTTVPIGAILALIERETAGAAAAPVANESKRPIPLVDAPPVDAAPKSSPIARRIARECGVNLSDVQGTGVRGRITKSDILAYVDIAHQKSASESVETARDAPESAAITDVDIRPLSTMRKAIAEHMIVSRRTSAHVHSIFHVNFSAIENFRRRMKREFEQAGARLTLTACVAKIVVDVLRRHPIMNASIQGENIVYKRDINLGIAVALSDGLIVPVIDRADERSLIGLSRAIADLAERARSRRLLPKDVQGGTFTLTNPGQFGAQFGLPIIQQPQAAILGIGTVEPRPVVVGDAIGIRTMAYLTVGFDHRLIDGAVADQFMWDLKNRLEAFEIAE